MDASVVAQHLAHILIRHYPPENIRAVLSLRWPSKYCRDDGQPYIPHSGAEASAVQSDTPRFVAFLGGEGAGKSVAGIIKTLQRLARGEWGIMVSPDLPHFRKSLWPEFRRWCPWQMVVQVQRYRSRLYWHPHGSFVLDFINGARLYCGGISEPQAWMGPNVHFAYLDEARRCRTPEAFKVLDGRVRLGQHPQLWIATTPSGNWLKDLFGPPIPNDPYAGLKSQLAVVTMRTEDNLQSLSPDFVTGRRRALSVAEAATLLDGEWPAEESESAFLAHMALWDSLARPRDPAWESLPLIIAMDAALTGDTFAIVGVTRSGESLIVDFAEVWEGSPEHPIDFDLPEKFLRNLAGKRRIIQICYDPYQLHHLASRLSRDRVAWMMEFSQGARRAEADKQLLDLILQGRIIHDGNPQLRQHLANADRQESQGRLRMVKRFVSQPIDLAVALSMACYQALHLRL